MFYVHYLCLKFLNIFTWNESIKRKASEILFYFSYWLLLNGFLMKTYYFHVFFNILAKENAEKIDLLLFCILAACKYLDVNSSRNKKFCKKKL